MQDATKPARQMPYINEQGELVIPFDAPPKYHYWCAGSQSILQTLAELNAPPEVMRRHERQTDQTTKEDDRCPKYSD